MNWSSLIRKTHRWVSIVFVAFVIALFAVQGMGVKPATWVFLTPLIPLAFLAITGLYMFALPYLTRRNA